MRSLRASTRSGIEYHHDQCRKFRWVSGRLSAGLYLIPGIPLPLQKDNYLSLSPWGEGGGEG